MGIKTSEFFFKSLILSTGILFSNIAFSQYQFPVTYKRISIPNSANYNNNIIGETFGLAEKEVILTFDDGPRPSTTPKILAALNKFNAKAVFFMIGHKVDSSTYKIVQDIASSGHAIGSHTLGSTSNGHTCIANTWNCKIQNVKDGISIFPSALSSKKAQREIILGHQMIAAALGGYLSPFFRFPFGEHDSDLTDFLSSKNLTAFHWHIDTIDAVNPSQDPNMFIQNTLSTLEENKKGIILFHDVVDLTAATLEQFLLELYNRGYKPVLPLPSDVPLSQVHPSNPTLLKIGL
jgi:peptidoglycan/xylan/chitin deacetylase (PgdA/CDA1 family)